MKNRIFSWLLILTLLAAVLPIPVVSAQYGPGYTTRTEKAFQYLVSYIQQNGQYPHGAASGDFKSVEIQLSDGVMFQMSEDELNDYALTFNIQMEYRDENDPYQSAYCLESLVLNNGYWNYQDNWLELSDWVTGWYYMSKTDGSGSSQVDLLYKVLPRLFSEQTGLTRITSYEGPEADREQCCREATLGVNDILTLIEPYLQRGGYSLRDLGFSAYAGHKTHRFWSDVVVVPPTCESEGHETQTCYICDTETVIPIPALGHAWNGGETVQEPGCTTEGVKRYTCSRCAETRDETLPALGHSWAFTEVLTEAEEGGLHACTGLYTCTRCAETKEAPLCAGEVFTDMPAEGNWAHEPIDWAWFNGITSGKTASTFAPKDTVTRAEAVTFLWTTLGRTEPEAVQNPFSDVPEGKYFYKSVMWAVENGITSGTTETTFGPKGKCTRAQIMMFLWAAAGRPEPETEENPFTDVSEFKYYYRAVLWAVESGITAGITPERFGPNNTCTRAQIVTFLYKAKAQLNADPKPEPDPDPDPEPDPDPTPDGTRS